MNKDRIGIIGGSGLYDMAELEVTEDVEVETPFGAPSDSLKVGILADHEVVFLPRHGEGHRLLPSELPFRANIWALKKLGVSRILSVSAVGSMRPDISPREVVVPDQFIDRTRNRKDTFFGDGLVAHIAFSDPVCPDLQSSVCDAAREAGAEVHSGGTYLCIEGPAFSTRAESHLYQSWDVDVIGMTNYQEAKLAREAEICYTTMACVTDYDCWNEAEESVTVERLMENLKHNVALARQTVQIAVSSLPQTRSCNCQKALENAIITDPKVIPDHTKEKLEIIAGDYI